MWLACVLAWTRIVTASRRLGMRVGRLRGALLNERFFLGVLAEGEFPGVFEFADDVDDLLLHPFDLR